MGLVVKKPGVITTIQDVGRFGYQGSGFSTNGVMDHRAFALAHLLVENDPGAPVLEFALAGPTVPPGGLYLTRLWYEDERLNG